MNCNHIQEKLFDFCEGKLSQDERLLIDKHTENCLHCKAMIAATKSWVSKNQELKNERANPFLADKIVSRLKETPIKTLSPILSATLRIAAVLIIAISAGILLNNALLKNAEDETAAATTETIPEYTGDATDPENLILTINE